MIKKYEMFVKILALVGENFEVVDADMSNYCDKIEVKGVSEGQEVTITVELENKEEAE